MGSSRSGNCPASGRRGSYSGSGRRGFYAPAERLTNTLQQLVPKQAVNIREDPDFNSDIKNLIRALEGYGVKKDRRSQLAAIMAFIAILSFILVTLSLPQILTDWTNPIQVMDQVDNSTMEVFAQIENRVLTIRAQITAIGILPLSKTSTTTIIATGTPIPLGVTGNPVTRNEDWRLQFQDFNGVPMALVPAGCFEMGNDSNAYYWNGADYVTGVPDGGEQRFYRPFWIDEYEVTNAQFTAFHGVARNRSYWADATRPRESIAWSEARDYCTQRGGRLPTEAEWEFAARGPDDWYFPWANIFNLANTVWKTDQTAVVGFLPAGASWVGAQDTSGNVWEWVSTAYETSDHREVFPYPYNSADGREDLQNPDVLRIVRGGAWSSKIPGVLRAASRYRHNPNNRDNDVGFRCARDYQP